MGEGPSALGTKDSQGEGAEGHHRTKPAWRPRRDSGRVRGRASPGASRNKWSRENEVSRNSIVFVTPSAITRNVLLPWFAVALARRPGGEQPGL